LHPDNYVEANNLVTPKHIQPEWYFLFAYAILRSIPDKLLGVLALFGSLLVLLVIPHIHFCHIKSLQFRPITKVLFWMFIFNFFILTWIGACPVEAPYIIIGQISSVFYFAYLLVLNPLAGMLENHLLDLEKQNKL
jgi:ubiquinol-cytochrome c reductase cytochrome b subunit